MIGSRASEAWLLVCREYADDVGWEKLQEGEREGEYISELKSGKNSRSSSPQVPISRAHRKHRPEGHNPAAHYSPEGKNEDVLWRGQQGLANHRVSLEVQMPALEANPEARTFVVTDLI